MPVLHADPDLEFVLHLDPYAPRAARHHVARVDRPSPDLRDAVILLTSELVTRAVQRDHTAAGEDVELRVWMPSDTVRVELQGARELVCRPNRYDGWPDFDLMLLDSIADRWSPDSDRGRACLWFEIDRHARSTAAGQRIVPPKPA